MRHNWSKLGVPTLTALLLCASPLGAQPTIEHEDVDCLPRGEFTRVLASIQPPSTIRAAKLYFRSSLYPEFYFVSMNLDERGSFGAVLPIPAAETMKVVYYFEAVDVSFQTARSEELEASVSGDESCRRGPGALIYPGTNPAIVVGATQLGAPAIPAGFQATGIAGFLTAAGAAGSGGGIGIGVAIGAAAGAAAGVGVLVAGGGDGGAASVTTTAPPSGGGGTTTIPAATTSIATTTTSPSGSTTTTVIGSPTTTTVSPATTTVSPATTTAPSPLTACFEWRALGNCRVYFDSCSTPENLVQRYEWRMLGPTVPEPPPVDNFTFSFESDPRCRGVMSFNYPVRLTVSDSLGRSDSVQQNVTVLSDPTYRTDEAATTATLSFESRLLAPPMDGSARGQIAVNGSLLPPSDNAAASRHDLRVATGIVRIQVTLTTPATPGSLWELDFSSSESLVAGSLKAESGYVAGAGERRVVFRLNGDRGETFQLRLSVR